MGLFSQKVTSPVGNTCQYFSAPRAEKVKVWQKIRSLFCVH